MLIQLIDKADKSLYAITFKFLPPKWYSLLILNFFLERLICTLLFSNKIWHSKFPRFSFVSYSLNLTLSGQRIFFSYTPLICIWDVINAVLNEEWIRLSEQYLKGDNLLLCSFNSLCWPLEFVDDTDKLFLHLFCFTNL